MANALIIKSGGGGLTVKSGGTVTIKDSGQPPYVIDGLEQSHWDAASAVVTGSSILSIPDSSNVQSLTPLGAPYVQASYQSTGWQLNGKTLPVANFAQVNPGAQALCIYSANQWASKISDYAGATTIALLFDWGSGLYSPNDSAAPFGWTNTTTKTSWQRGPVPAASGKWFLQKRSPQTGWWGFETGTHATGKQIMVVEFSNDAPAASASNNYRLWINGSLQTNVATAAAGWSPLSGLDVFSVGGFTTWGGSYDYFSMKLAQMHIWKGALTDQQRTDVTAYLKSISGIA